jgi:hypothetical protein
VPVRAGKPRHQSSLLLRALFGGYLFRILAAITRTFTLNFMKAEELGTRRLPDFAYIAEDAALEGGDRDSQAPTLAYAAGARQD